MILAKKPKWADDNLGKILLDAFAHGEIWNLKKRQSVTTEHGLDERGPKRIANWFGACRKKFKATQGSPLLGVTNPDHALLGEPSALPGEPPLDFDPTQADRELPEDPALLGEPSALPREPPVDLDPAQVDRELPEDPALLGEPSALPGEPLVDLDLVQADRSLPEDPALLGEPSALHGEPPVDLDPPARADRALPEDPAPPGEPSVDLDPAAQVDPADPGTNNASRASKGRRRKLGGGGSKIHARVLTAQGKRDKALMKSSQSNKKDENAMKKVTNEKIALEARIAQNFGRPCPIEGCTRIFHAASWNACELNIAKHLSKDECTGGTNPFRKGKSGPSVVRSFKDRSRQCIRENGVSNVKWMRNVRSIPDEKLQLGPKAGSYKLYNGEEYRVLPVGRGYACKAKRRGARQYTTDQLKFIQWCYMQGVPGSHGGSKGNKYSSDRAEKEMRLHGTAKGSEMHSDHEYWNGASARTFPARQQLDHWVFKQWFSCPLDKFKRSIASQMKKKAVPTSDFIVDDIEDME
jgi:hypothetical protein